LVAAAVAMLVGSLFAAGDTALGVLPEARLQAMSSDSGPDASAFRRYTQDPLRIISRWLLARVVCISVSAALVFRATEASGYPAWATPMAVITAVVAYGTFTEIFGTLARRRPERVGALALRYLRPLEWLAVPLAEPFVLIGRLIGRHFPPSRTVDARMTETEVEWAVSEGERAGAIANEPAEMIRKVLDFKDLTAREVMVPRRRIIGVELNTPLDKVVEYVANEGHSRYPVYRETLDNIVGLLYAKDLFAVVRDGRIATTKLSELMRTPVMFLAETQSLAKILPEMQARRLHIAIVSDEFGGTAGMVTLEDILEEIVGDIRDEYDVDAQIQPLGDGRVVADAAVSLADLAEHLGKPLPADGEFESLGGLIVHRAGRVPTVGSTVHVDGMKLIVREADATRVVKVEIVQDRPSMTAAAS
jgi:CBS domain containing-hemolysin-like protein